jgi:hypothetical protein
VSGSTGVVITIHDALSAHKSTSTTLLSSTIRTSCGSVVDNNGNPWAIQNNKIYTYDSTLSSNIIGLSSENIIEGVACDKDNNIWVIHSFNKLTKLNNNRQSLFTSTLSSLSGVVYNRYIDFISQFSPVSGYVTDCITLNQSVSGAKLIKVDLQGYTETYTSVLTGDVNDSTGVTFFDMSMIGCKTTTGFDYLRKHTSRKYPRLEAKLALSDIYNSSTTTATYSALTLSYNISALPVGWNNFSVVFNSELGEYNLYINTVLVDSVSTPQARFSQSDIFEQPLTIGASPFYTKLFLPDHLQQPKHYLSKDIIIKNLKLYDKALDYFDLKAHYGVVKGTSPVRWSIPVGQRNYIDTIERVFRHRVPGRKSEIFNVDIRNTLLTDATIKADIEGAIKQQLSTFIPSHAKLNTITWNSDLGTTSLSTTPAVPSIQIQPSTSQGKTTSYGY